MAVARSLRVYSGGVSFPGCLWTVILLVPLFGLTQVPPGGAHLSVEMDSSVRVSRRLAGHIMGWHLLPPFVTDQGSWPSPINTG